MPDTFVLLHCWYKAAELLNNVCYVLQHAEEVCWMRLNFKYILVHNCQGAHKKQKWTLDVPVNELSDALRYLCCHRSYMFLSIAFSHMKL